MYRKGTILKRYTDYPTTYYNSLLMKITGLESKNPLINLIDLIAVRSLFYRTEDILNKEDYYYWGFTIKKYYKEISKEEAFVDVL